ncbi:hypothetical protein BsWGS_21188 [Bradybaena similaris]
MLAASQCWRIRRALESRGSVTSWHPMSRQPEAQVQQFPAPPCNRAPGEATLDAPPRSSAERESRQEGPIRDGISAALQHQQPLLPCTARWY